jgi:hypothetical protein
LFLGRKQNPTFFGHDDDDVFYLFLVWSALTTVLVLQYCNFVAITIWMHLQAHREIETHFTDTRMQLQQNNQDMFRLCSVAFYQSLKSKVGLAAAKTAALISNHH